MPAWSFITITATTAFPWTLFMFLLVRLAPVRGTQLMSRFGRVALSELCVFGLPLVWRLSGPQIRNRVRLRVAQLSKWEFWPAWIFYPPVALYCVWQGIKHHSFSLPAVANLNQKNGGIVGESKIGILSKLMAPSPNLTAKGFLVEAHSAAIRLARISELCLQHEIGMPFLLKPDIAQRGAGFKKIQSLEDVREYLSQVSDPSLRFAQFALVGLSDAVSPMAYCLCHWCSQSPSGFRPPSPYAVWRDWREFAIQACEFPLAD